MPASGAKLLKLHFLTTPMLVGCGRGDARVGLRGVLMRGRILATACSVLTGLMSVSTVSAAPSVAGIAPSRLAPAAISAPDHSNQFVNFALGSVAIPSLGRDGTSFSSIARVTNPGQGLQLEMARGRNWDIYGDLFPGASALRSSYLLGSSNFAGMKLALGDSLSLAMGHDG